MNTRSVTVALAALLAVLLYPSTARAQALTQAERTAVLAALNEPRANLQPSADPIPTMTWDPALEAIAQRWTLTCTPDAVGSGLLAHNPNRNVGYPGSVGENIAAATGHVSLRALVDQWTSEARDFNVMDNTCAGEPSSIHSNWKKCGHYTQVVWATTTKVGCGRNLCPNLKYPLTFVCDFSNAGNTYDPDTGAIARPYPTTVVASPGSR